MEQIVQGHGAHATSFPPADTMSISSDDMLSRMNLSCGSQRKVRSFSVVSSTVFGGGEEKIDQFIWLERRALLLVLVKDQAVSFEL
jgi:hypothetical protein